MGGRTGPWSGCRAVELGLYWAQGRKQTIEIEGTGGSSSLGRDSREFKGRTEKAPSRSNTHFPAAIFSVLPLVTIILLPPHTCLVTASSLPGPLENPAMAFGLEDFNS